MAIGGWLGRSKGTDADRLVAALGELPPLERLAKIADALEHAESTADANALDVAAQPLIAAARTALLADARGGHVSEVGAGALSRYAQRAAAHYTKALESEQSPLYATRGIAALAQRNKYSRLSYRAPEASQWQALHALYGRARALAAHRFLVELYPGLPKTAARSEYLIALMLETVPLGSLAPAQIECLDFLLHRHAEELSAGDKPSPETLFFADPAKPQPPQRFLPGLPARSAMLFIGPGGALARLAELRRVFAQEAKPPEWATACGCDAEAFGALLSALEQHWSDKPPQRRDRREAAGGDVLLVNGFAQARRMVLASEHVKSDKLDTHFDGAVRHNQGYFDRTRFGSVDADRTTTGKLLRDTLRGPQRALEKLELADGKQVTERSAVADASESGLGVALPARTGWARLGVLVGYRMPDSLDWQLAVVRRIGRGTGTLQVGLERLLGTAKAVRCLAVKDADAARESKPSGTGVRDGILLEGGERLLILPFGQHSAGQLIAAWTDDDKLEVLRVLGAAGTAKDYRVFMVETAG